LAVIDVYTIESVDTIVNHIESQVFIPIVYTSKDQNLHCQRLSKEFCHSCIHKDGSEVLFRSSIETTIKIYRDIRAQRNKYSEQYLIKNEDYKAIFDNENVVINYASIKNIDNFTNIEYSFYSVDISIFHVYFP